MGQCTHMMSNDNNKSGLKYFNFLFLNIHKMKGHWNQIGKHVICFIKHKWKSKNQNMPYQQAQDIDLTGLQTPLQSNL